MSHQLKDDQFYSQRGYQAWETHLTLVADTSRLMLGLLQILSQHHFQHIDTLGGNENARSGEAHLF